MTEQELKKAEKAFDDLLKYLDVSGTYTLDEADDVVQVGLETDDSGMVIGYHGEVLESLQLVSSLVLTKTVGRYVRVNIEVGDYKRNREDYLKNLAEKVRTKALEENREQVISDLKPWERRVVHMYYQDDSEVVSESTGEGRDRVLVVKPK